LTGIGISEVWLPIDAKFPTEDYDRLLLASEAGDREEEMAARKALERRIRDEAKRIAGKYISTAEAGLLGALCVIGKTVTTVAPSASRSIARTITVGLSFCPSSRPASCSWCQR
jgi:hypothetical protein